MQKKIIVIALVVAFGIPTVMAGVFIAVWYGTPLFRERVLEAALLSRIYPVQKAAARELRQYPSQAAALTLITAVNFLDKSDRLSEEVAEETLATLCLMSGQDFGTDFSGAEYNFSWSPPGKDDWPEIVENVNGWALETFGVETLGAWRISVAPEQAEPEQGGEETP